MKRDDFISKPILNIKCAECKLGKGSCQCSGETGFVKYGKNPILMGEVQVFSNGSLIGNVTRVRLISNDRNSISRTIEADWSNPTLTNE